MPALKNKIQIEKCLKSPKLDFSKVGGLTNHIRILKDILIFPLIHCKVYSHFNIKVPRGVLFYGPPGTGKTLVAAALATEISKETRGNKVSFYHRKGADVLDKWAGESERKLRHLFDIATKNRPSIIFFDELDGLAPVRSTKNDHIHCSLVTTLLALMDGLDSTPGVIIIGATNRIEALDPALRRPGRFDRELYFPLPSTDARQEILKVHTQTWHCKPSNLCLECLSENTPGFCGADLQALCAEAVLCCIKRTNPDLDKIQCKIKLETDKICVKEEDFWEARQNLVASNQKLGNKMRKLSQVVMPLLQRQLNSVLEDLRRTWPHFFAQFHKYLIGNERYVGRLLLIGSSSQGVDSHLIPAILQNFEHLPHYVLEASFMAEEKLLNFTKNLPSILVLPQIDKFWKFLEPNDQVSIVQILESIYSGLPILVVASCEEEVPTMLQNFFFNNSTLVKVVENPNEDEVEHFFTYLFFEKIYRKARKINKVDLNVGKNVYQIKSGRIEKKKSKFTIERKSNVNTFVSNLTSNFSLILSNLLMRRQPKIKTLKKSNSSKKLFENSKETDRQIIFDLWKRTVFLGKEMNVAKLEILYDTILASINMYDFKDLIEDLEKTLIDIELSQK